MNNVNKIIIQNRNFWNKMSIFSEWYKSQNVTRRYLLILMFLFQLCSCNPILRRFSTYQILIIFGWIEYISTTLKSEKPNSYLSGSSFKMRFGTYLAWLKRYYIRYHKIYFIMFANHIWINRLKFVYLLEVTITI